MCHRVSRIKMNDSSVTYYKNKTCNFWFSTCKYKKSFLGRLTLMLTKQSQPNFSLRPQLLRGSLCSHLKICFFQWPLLVRFTHSQTSTFSLRLWFFAVFKTPFRCYVSFFRCLLYSHPKVCTICRLFDVLTALLWPLASVLCCLLTHNLVTHI